MDVETVDEAVEIILCPTEGMTAKQRWSDETPALMCILERFIARNSLVLDYGCGIGRLAKPLISKHDCKVVGVDISANMCALATSCVDSRMFCALSPFMFDELIGNDVFDAVISVWALQHCLDLEEAISDISRTLKSGGKLVLVNNKGLRSLPIENGEWADDGQDIEGMIVDAGFSEVENGRLDESVAPGWMRDGTFWAVYQKT
jgi:SAM-dependent methyltransferase